MLLASVSAATEIALPTPQESAEVLARAEQANWWEEGEYQVWVLRGGCEITQANLTARSEEAVLWVKRPDTFNGDLGCAWRTWKATCALNPAAWEPLIR